MAKAQGGGHASWQGTVFNTVNNIIGAGLLSIPWAAKESSMLVGLGVLATVAILNYSTLLALARCCELSGAFGYKEMGKRTFGVRFGMLIEAAIMCYTLGSCTSYVVLIGDFIPRVLSNETDNAFLDNRIAMILIMATVFLFPLCLLKNLSMFRFSSFTALMFILYATGVFVHNYAEHGMAESVEIAKFQPQMFAGVPVMNVAFTMHYNSPRFYEELRGRSIKRIAMVNAIAFCICFTIYALAVTCGYGAFGADTAGDILNSFSDSDVAPLIARLALAFAITCVFPLAFRAFRNAIFMLVPRLDPGESTVRHVLTTAAILCVPVGIGIALPQVQIVLSFNGALFGTCVVYFFPVLMYAALQGRHRAGYTRLGQVRSRTQSSINSSSHAPLQRRVSGSVNQAITPVDAMADAHFGAPADISASLLDNDALATDEDSGLHDHPGDLDGAAVRENLMHAGRFLCSWRGLGGCLILVWGAVTMVLAVLTNAGVIKKN